MASVTPRNNANGTRVWRAQVRVTGQGKGIARTFDRKADAVAWAAQIESDLRSGRYLDRTTAERKTVAEWIRLYLKSVPDSLKSIATKRQRLLTIAADEIGSLAVANLRPQHIADFRDRLLSKKRKVMGAAARTKTGTARNRLFVRDERLRFDQAVALLRNAYAAAAIRLALETAMRQGELLSVRWKHVQMDERYLHLPDTKNGSSRDAPLSPAALLILAQFQSLQTYDSEGAVLQITADALRSAFVRICKQARLDDFRFHDLRHVAATNLARVFPNIADLARVTGHKSAQMVM